MPFAGWLLIVLGLIMACAPTPKAAESADPQGERAIQRTLVMFTGVEAPSYAEKALQIVPNPRAHGKEILNARLVLLDERGLARPFLAEALPALNTDSWRVLPDGNMETTFRLAPNLTWHDGAPLTAEDFAFAARVYATPAFGVAGKGGFRYVKDVMAPDPRSVVIRWSQPYPDAVDDTAALPPLPRHLLDQPFQSLSADAFMMLPFWTTEYVGAGPWRLTQREPGAFFEAAAFDGFVFGRPRIDRIRVVYIPDSNISVASMLAGEVHFSFNNMLYGDEGLVLESGWGANGPGKVLWEPLQGRGMEFQMRPQHAVPTHVATDTRVRQAIYHLIDKELLWETITSGKGVLRHVYTHPEVDYYDVIARAAPIRYRYDPRRAEQLLTEARFTRRADGSWLTPEGDRFTFEQGYLTSASNERESQILVAGLRQAGIDATSQLFGIQRTSNEERYTSPGLFGGAVFIPRYRIDEIAGPENRWTGGNRWGYANPEVDRLSGLWDTTLDRPQRIQVMAQLERIANEEVPVIPLYFTANVIAHASGLKGIVQNLNPDAGQERRMWEWYWAS
jgi:peptide/nickel transport system substrate-binding protein